MRLKKGQIMFDVLNFWNNKNKSIIEEQNLKPFERKILEEQCKFTKCEKTKCYGCE